MPTITELKQSILAPNDGYAIARVSNEWEQTWVSGETTLLIDKGLFSSLFFHLPEDFNNDEILVKVTNSSELNPLTITTIDSYSQNTWTPIDIDNTFGSTCIQLVTNAAPTADRTCYFMAQG